jgi:PAS domain S-box-containing protein
MVESVPELLTKVDVRETIERKKAEEALRESEKKYRTLFEEAMDAMFVADAQTGIIIDCNRLATELVGRTKSELIGKHQRILHPQQDSAEEGFSKTFQQHLKEREGQVLETQVITKKGEIKEVAIKANLIELAGKRVLQATFRDITKRKKAEEALRESEEKFRTIFENVNEMIIYVDNHGKILDVNERSVEITGFRKDEVVGKNFLRTSFLRFRDIPKMAKIFKDVTISGKDSTLMQLEAKHKNGNMLPVEVSSRVVRKNGKIEGFLCIVRDITERKKAELALRESEEKFRSIFEGVADGVIYLDKYGKILNVNRKAFEIFGGSAEELLGKRFTEIGIFSPKQTLLLMRNLAGILRGKKTILDVNIKNKNGQVISLECSASLLKTGDQTMIAAVLRDVSERKKAEEALRQSEEKLRVVGGLTRHDARNRLTLVTVNTCLAKKCLHGNNEAEDYLDKIEAAVHDVVGIFDFAEIYEMLGVEKPTYVDVEKAMNDAASLFPTLKTVKVIIECHGLAVLADSLIRQAFYNLIDDSLKYAQNLTQIKVYYERENSDHLKLIYEDDGVGIPLDKKPRLFQRGYTAGKGSGYGLYLIQKMIEIYGWTIQETGEPGKGVRFVMKIPRLNKDGRELYHLNAKT